MIKIYIIGFVVVLFLVAFAGIKIQEKEFNSKMEKESNFLKEMKEDCARTAEKVNKNPGSTWKDHAGWMYEDQCERFERGYKE